MFKEADKLLDPDVFVNVGKFKIGALFSKLWIKLLTAALQQILLVR